MPPGLSLLLAVFAFFLGASIGSFLNVCIYRMPRDLSVNNPRRSFCPHCKYQIPWWNNLPIISWLALRGKCGNCKEPIPFRYIGVELLTALLFLGLWLSLWPDRFPLAIPYWVFASLLVVATFIDFEFFIIPDEITWGGAVAGVIFSAALPLLQRTESHLNSVLLSLLGGAFGYLLLWLIVQFGKMAFGKKRYVFKKPEHFTWVRKGDDADLKVGEEMMLWSDFFARGNEELLMSCSWLEIDGKRLNAESARWTLNFLHVGEEKWELEKTDVISGEVSNVVYPREAMGFGDVKFMACIGAFLGWQAVLFTLVFASIVGSVVGVTAIVTGRREATGKIPFGPYLAAGALLWVFFGPPLVQWYLGLLTPPDL